MKVGSPRVNNGEQGHFSNCRYFHTHKKIIAMSHIFGPRRRREAYLHHSQRTYASSERIVSIRNWFHHQSLHHVVAGHRNPAAKSIAQRANRDECAHRGDFAKEDEQLVASLSSRNYSRTIGHAHVGSTEPSQGLELLVEHVPSFYEPLFGLPRRQSGHNPSKVSRFQPAKYR